MEKATPDTGILTASTATILNDPGNHSKIFDELQELHHLYASHTGISACETQGEDLDLAWGKAIGPSAAALCLLEFVRTAKFIRGVYFAILRQQELYPGKKIGILYAGCGPYAALLTPITTLFSAKEVAFRLMDVNATALSAVKKLYERLDLLEYVKAFILDDAVVYRLPDPAEVHVVISETMNLALTKEPQVRIMQNLIPQLTQDAVFIPQEILITAKLTGSENESEAARTGRLPERIDLGTVYTISSDKLFLEGPATIKLPENMGNFGDLKLFTDVRIFGDVCIRENESTITMPWQVCEVAGLEGRKISFNYVTGRDPRFEYLVEDEGPRI